MSRKLAKSHENLSEAKNEQASKIHGGRDEVVGGKKCVITICNHGVMHL